MTQFHEFLRDFKGGHLDAMLSEKLRELVDAVGKFQKEGKLIIEVGVEPKMEGEMLTTIKFKAKVKVDPIV